MAIPSTQSEAVTKAPADARDFCGRTACELFTDANVEYDPNLDMRRHVEQAVNEGLIALLPLPSIMLSNVAGV
jgi:hypothetical protein